MVDYSRSVIGHPGDLAQSGGSGQTRIERDGQRALPAGRYFERTQGGQNAIMARRQRGSETRGSACNHGDHPLSTEKILHCDLGSWSATGTLDRPSRHNRGMGYGE